ncbi:MAG: TRAP transporter substrate-binding protein [Kiloniellaceae bacterium]
MPMRSVTNIAAVAALVGAVTLGVGASADAQTKLKMQSAWNPNLPALGETAKYFADTVAAASGGEVIFKFYGAKKLVPTLQIFDAVSAGTIDAGFSWPRYWMGKMPALTLFAAVPFGPEAPEFLAWIYHGGGLDIWRELYARQGVVPVPCGILAPEASGWFADPIDSTKDLEGLKIRFAGLGGEIMRKLGASVTMLAAGDIFPNLERGVIDATEFSMPAIDRVLGFYKIVKHYYFPGWHQPSSILELVVNKKQWDAMSERTRAYVEMACGNAVLWGLTKGIAAQPTAVQFFKDNGVQIHTWSPEMIAAFRKTAAEVIEEQSAKDADFRRAWDSLKAFREKNAEWRGMAYAR